MSQHSALFLCEPTVVKKQVGNMGLNTPDLCVLRTFLYDKQLWRKGHDNVIFRQHCGYTFILDPFSPFVIRVVPPSYPRYEAVHLEPGLRNPEFVHHRFFDCPRCWLRLQIRDSCLMRASCHFSLPSFSLLTTQCQSIGRRV